MVSVGSQFLVLSQVCTAISLYHVLYLYQNWRTSSIWGGSLRGLAVFLTGSCGLLTYDVYRRIPSKSHTFKTALLQYFMGQVFSIFGYFTLRKFTKASKNVSKMQEDILMFYIRNLENTEFGKKYNYSQIKSREDFLKLHPVLSYDDLRPYIDKTVEGEKNQIVPYDPHYIAYTSGTTGKNKAFVYTKELFVNQSTMSQLILFSYVMQKESGILNTLQRYHEVRVGVKTGFTSKGIRTGPIAGLFEYLPTFLVSPPAVYDIKTDSESQYLHALFALKEPDIIGFAFSFPSVATRFCRTLEHQWEQLCDDLERGTLDELLDIPLDVREKIETKMSAEPQRAEQTRRIMKQGFEGIVHRLWPGCKFATILCSGSFIPEAETLKKHYLKGIPFYNPVHAASEGFFGFPDPNDTGHSRFVLLTSLNHYDFIPVDEADKPSPGVVPIEEVKIGECYELVVTTPVAMRYRQGDVVKIVDYFNQVPVYEFQYRQGQMLNLFCEKMTEGVFVHALLGAAKRAGADITDYTATENVNFEAVAEPLQNGRHYVLFVELAESSMVLTEDQCKMFEKVLYEEHEVYKILRDKRSILPMKVIQVRTGCFQDLREEILASNERTSRIQYKTPRVLRKPERLAILWKQRLQ